MFKLRYRSGKELCMTLFKCGEIRVSVVYGVCPIYINYVEMKIRLIDFSRLIMSSSYEHSLKLIKFMKFKIISSLTFLDYFIEFLVKNV